jgi:hypothetical protein
MDNFTNNTDADSVGDLTSGNFVSIFGALFFYKQPNILTIRS